MLKEGVSDHCHEGMTVKALLGYMPMLMRLESSQLLRVLLSIARRATDTHHLAVFPILISRATNEFARSFRSI